MDVYQISHVPFTIEPLDFTVVVIVSAIVICFAATIYPSRLAAALDPAQALVQFSTTIVDCPFIEVSGLTKSYPLPGGALTVLATSL